MAHADPPKKPVSDEARRHLKQGSKLYNIRSFEQAIEEYKAGALVEEAPVFDYNLGQCFRQLGKYREAIWHYERFLSHGDPQGEMLDAVNGFLTQMKSELNKQAMTQKPTEPASAAPTPPVSAAPSPPSNTLASHTDVEHQWTPHRKLAVGIGGGGGVLIGIGVILGFHARNLQREANDICPMVNCNRADDANMLIERGKNNAIYANLAYGAGAAAVIGAVVLWFSDPSSEPRRVAVTPEVTHTYAGLDASWRF